MPIRFLLNRKREGEGKEQERVMEEGMKIRMQAVMNGKGEGEGRRDVQKRRRAVGRKYEHKQ